MAVQRLNVLPVEDFLTPSKVVVDEGLNQVSYGLDEGLIEFGTAMDDGDFDRCVMLTAGISHSPCRAVNFLESLEMNAESSAMWRSLAQTTLDCNELGIAERYMHVIARLSSLA